MPVLNSKGNPFIDCGGCGGLFDPDNPNEVEIYNTHDCETYGLDDDNEVDDEPEVQYLVPVWVVNLEGEHNKLKFKDWASAVAFANRFNADPLNKGQLAYLEGE